MKYTIRFLIFISIFILNSSPSFAIWPIYHKPEFKGKVIDTETKEPIEGAVVVVVYNKITYAIIEQSTDAIKAKETLTDKHGEFYFPPYTTLIASLSGEHYASFIFYKPGYGSDPVVLKSLTRTSEEMFFSKEIGVTGVLEGAYMFNGKNPIIEVTFGIVELPELKTKEERLRAIPSSPKEFRSKELPLLYKAINYERRRLGLEGEEK